MSKKSCVSDSPLTSCGATLASGGDSLNNKPYVDGLQDFILHAEAPVTIGVQGGWGTGKTSLINMLQERLKESEDDHTVCVFVNAWEYSLFQAQGSKADVTLSLLQGLLDEMQEAMKICDKIPQFLKIEVEAKDGPMAKAKKIGLGLTLMVAKMALKQFADLEIPAKDGETEKETPSTAKVVRELRKAIEEAVTKVVNTEGAPKRFVFFIDDLDRVLPETAIEILDVTKNVFDIPHCIFVLAIDYDVVVKGLESKFGKKTDENEREFRQYFDKIIQIPFTMPVGSYEKPMAVLLNESFQSLGFIFAANDGDAAILNNIREAALAATDGIPRSVKRVINTLSLLQRISTGKGNSSDSDTARMLNDLEIRFVVICLHINFPEICRKLMEKPQFTDWDIKQLTDLWDLKYDPKHLESLKENYGDLFDEGWEQVVYGLCQKSHWLKTKTKSASNLLNALRRALKRQSKNAAKPLSEDELNVLLDVLSDIRIVSVENIEPPAVDNSKNKTDQISIAFRNVHKALIGKIPGLDADSDNHYASGRGKGYREYEVEITGDQQICDITFQRYSSNDLNLGFLVVGPNKGKVAFRKRLKEMCVKEGLLTNNYSFCYCTFPEQTYESYSPTTFKTDYYAEEAVKLYGRVKRICQSLA